MLWQGMENIFYVCSQASGKSISTNARANQGDMNDNTWCDELLKDGGREERFLSLV